MPQISAGIMMWRRRAGAIEVLLAHFGGPYWANRDVGAWGIPKGLVEEGEDLEWCARREFEEELGVRPDGDLTALGRVRLKSGKWIEAFALRGDLDAAAITSNHFSIEWPPRSGRTKSFPEVDRAQWFPIAAARVRINPGQLTLLDRLETAIEADAA